MYHCHCNHRHKDSGWASYRNLFHGCHYIIPYYGQMYSY